MAVVTLHLINTDVGPQTIKSRATDVFHLQAYIFPKTGNTGGGSVALAINCTDSRGVNGPTTVTAKSVTVPATGSWSQLDGYATVPTGYDTVDPVLTLTSVPVTDIVYVDDALVRQETLAQQIIGSLFGGTAIAASVLPAAVPNLDASKVTTGTFAQSFITGLTTLWTSWFGTSTPTGSSVLNAANVASLDASKITSGSLTGATVPGSQLTGGVAQSLITGLTTLWTSWFGTPTPTGSSTLAAANVAPLDASKITSGSLTGATVPATRLTSGAVPAGVTLPGSQLTGSVLSSLLSGAVALGLIPALPASQITSGTLGTGQIPVLDASKITSGTLGIGQIPVGSLNASNITDLGTAYSNAQGAIDGIHQGVTGGYATGVSDSTIAPLLQAFPASNVVPVANPSISGIPVHGTAGTGWAANTSAGGVYSIACTGSHTKATADNWVGTWVIFACSSGAIAAPYNVDLEVVYGSQSGGANVTLPMMFCSTIWHSGNNNWALAYCGGFVPTSVTGAQTITATASQSVSGYYMYGIMACSDSYSGVISARAADQSNYLQGTTSTTSASEPSVPSASNDLIVQAFAANLYLATMSITGYNKTARSSIGGTALNGAYSYIQSGESAGASSVSFAATLSSASAYYAFGAINLIGAGTASLGSGFRATRTSTSAVATGTANTSVVLPASFFNAGADAVSTSDYGWNTSTGTVTVANAGWYQVTLQVMQNSAFGSNYLLGLELFHNGSNARHGPRINQGGYANIMHAVWNIYCNAGDTLQGGTFNTFGAISALIGEATGIGTFFEVSLANRSLL